jgi:small subunit ribosomal protein S9
MINKGITHEGITISGKRKRAVAKATIKPGNGRITINKINYETLQFLHKLAIQEPIDITKRVLKKEKLDFDINVNVKGGGQEGQIEASRLSIARAIVKFTKSAELKKAFLEYDKNLLIADVRRKEPNKPGDSKARSRRQKSFR